MVKLNKLARNDISRIFIAPNKSTPLAEYDYYNCMKIDGLDKALPGITVAQCPHPTQAKKFITVAEIESGEDSRWSTSLTGRMPLDQKSILFDLVKNRRSFDLQIHLGECIDVSDFNAFTLAIILENVQIDNYSTDPIVALESGEVALINEVASITAGNVEYIYTPTLNEVGEEVSTNGAIVDMTISPADDCSLTTKTILFGLKIPSSAVGNDIYIIYSEDNGTTWKEVLLDCAATLAASILTSYNITASADRLFITLNESSGNGHLYIVKIADVLSGSDGSPIISSLDNVNAIYDQFLFSNTLVTVGAAGVINSINGNSLTYTTLPHSNSVDLYTIHGLSEKQFLVGGANGTLMLYDKDSGFRTIAISTNNTTVTDKITKVFMLDENIWFVGTDAGKLLATVNGGTVWYLKESFSGCINGITFLNSIVGFITLKTGEIYRTVDSGATWVEIDDYYNQLPTNAEAADIIAIDANTVFSFGRVPNGSVPNPCDPLNTFITGDVGWILKGSA